MCRGWSCNQIENLPNLVDQTRAIGGGEEDRLGFPVAEGAGSIAVGGRGVLFEHGVGIDAREAERIDAGPARRCLVGVNPGAGDRIQGERAPGGREQTAAGCSACKVGGKTR